jgi:hypothetical protein
MRFRVGDHGEVFSTRPKGAALLTMLEEGMGAASEVEVDFENVRNVSYSFADEFVGELLERVEHGVYACRVVLTHVPPNAERVIAGSLQRRGLKGVAVTVAS